MRRSFPVLASVVGLALAASLASTMTARGEVDARIGVGAGLATIGLHGMVSSSLASGRRRSGAMASATGLPEWVGGQIEKNRGKAAVPGAIGALLAAGTIGALWLRPDASWRVGLVAFNLAFQVGAFVGEYAVLTSQARWTRELAGWPARSSGS